MEIKTKNTLGTILFFIAGMLSLNVLPSSPSTHLLGIAFIISSVYGVVAINKNAIFIFK